MKKDVCVGLIGGGQMGEALIRGMLDAGLLGAGNIMVAEPDAERRTYMIEKYGITGTDQPGDLCSFARVLILAVKPQIVRPVLGQYKACVTDDHLLISIAAGISIGLMEEILGKRRIIRVMPNTPALVLAGASGLSPNDTATEEDLALAMEIFSAIGTCVHVPETLLDAVTGLSGSGPGYVFTFIEAMIDGGVLAGLPRPIATELVLQTVYGSAKLALESGKNPAELKGMVTSPGGTTIAGIHELEQGGLRGTVMAAVDRASKRSQELGG